MSLHKIGARDSWFNSWEHQGEDIYCPRALFKILGCGTTFFFAFKTALDKYATEMLPGNRLCTHNGGA